MAPGGSIDPLFNVPIITKEEEQAERDALSEREQWQLDMDLYGRVRRETEHRALEEAALELSSHETQDEIRRGVAAMNEAIEAMPDSEKADYMKAKEVASTLFETESRPADFLRCEDYSSAAAATRLVSYWRQRKNIFGEDLAFLPLRLDGALRDDIDFLEQGYLVPLPLDAHGRPVILLDQVCTQPTPSVLRATMYITHAVTSHDTSPKCKRVVHIANMQGLDLLGKIEKYRSSAKKEIAMHRALPVILASHHIFTGPGKSAAGMILPALKHIYGKHVRLRTRLHSGTAKEVAIQVEEFGLCTEHIDLVYCSHADRQAKMQQWILEQKRRELDKEEQVE